MKITLLLVGLGGALGSMLRYLTTHFFAHRISTHFPVLYGTFSVNFIGCLLIGIVFGIAERYDWLSPQWRLFLTTGFCGGYTTFSAFVHENIRLLENGHYTICFIYILVSIIICLAATFIGLTIVKTI